MSVGLVLGLILAGAPAAASPAATGTPEFITRPRWTHKPSGEDMARVYPLRAQDVDLDGDVVIECQVTAAGTLSSCRAAKEEPQGEGFAEAALKLSVRFKMEATDAVGQSTPGRTVRIPILFVLPGRSVTRPQPIPSAELAGAELGLDCRSRGAVLDNCFVVDAKPASPDIWRVAQQIEAKLLETKSPYPDGRVEIRFRLVAAAQR